MDLIQFAIFIIAFVGLFTWNRSESRSDARMALSLIESMRQDSKNFQTTMMEESKEFHGRLCAIEERNKK